MAEITTGQKLDLLAEIRQLLPDAEFSKEKSWRGQAEVDFQDFCGCYSEWTQEPCYFEVFISGTLPVFNKDQYSFQQAIENRVKRWVQGSLFWSGCECCGEDYISVSVRLFSKK